ncbi:MAG: membrane protein insertase YidC [Verrucomicrobiota bacterium]
MDRTSWIALIVCFLLLFLYQPILYYFFPEWKQPAPAPASETAQPAAPAAPASPVTSDLVTPAPATGAAIPVIGQDETAVPSRPVNVPEALQVISNDYFDVTFTNWGGAIKSITLNEHQREDGLPIVLNDGSPLPIFSIAGWQGMPGSFTATEITASSVTYQMELQPGVKLERVYTLSDGYQIECIQTVYVPEGQGVVMPPFHLALGTMAPIYGTKEERRFTGLAWHTPNPGGHYDDASMTSFYPGFMGLWGNQSEIASDSGDPIQWAALKTQFFTVIMNLGDVPGEEVRGIKQRLPGARDAVTGLIPEGVMASVRMPGFQVNASYSQTFNLYAGPKEDHRLHAMPTGEDRLMQFGWMGIISRPMLRLMNLIHDGVDQIGVPHAYGVAIIIMTIILRGILWWPQTKANLSMKRMQTVAPLMKELQEKFKEKPDKLNQEMMKLYQDYGVNPFGGCLPILIQFPIFLGFYYMLLGSIELRHEHFLWIKDLSQPDTVLHITALEFIPIFQGNINPMPLVMAVTMYITMTITPQPAGVDNPMMKVMKFMPVMFLVFCYNFASALSLYWTMQNLLSIVQMKYNMKHEPPTLEALKQESLERKKAKKQRNQGFGMSARRKKRK